MARSKKAQAAIDGALSLDVHDERVGLGVDLVDIERMRTIMQRTKSFEAKYFSDEERAYCSSKADPIPHFAVRFAAKEAVVKALGCGFTKGIMPRDISIVKAPGKRPYAELSGAAALVAEELSVTEIPISLSHTATDAIAIAIALKEGTSVRAVMAADPATELARTFKETRSMLDELPSTSAAHQAR